jgi:hypothetical protein
MGLKSASRFRGGGTPPRAWPLSPISPTRVLNEALRDPDANVRVRAAALLADRVYGKPTQHVVSESTDADQVEARVLELKRLRAVPSTPDSGLTAGSETA